MVAYATDDVIELDHYYRQARPEVCDLVEGADLRVLDLGCASGQIGSELKRRGVAGVVDGVELHPEAADVARTVLDRVWCASLETFDFESVAEGYDVLVVADVLEHLVDPWETMSRAAVALRPGGKVVGSFPNIRYIRVLLALAVRGRFEYGPSGVLDRTHLRFFTRHSIERLFEDAGLHVEFVERAPAVWRGRLTSGIAAALGDLGAEQLLVRASR